MTDPAGAGFARLVLRLSALAFGGIGAAFFLAPATMGALIGLTVAGATADNDVRAVYGGLQLGCGLLLAWSSRRPETLRFGIAAQLMLFGGLALGRLVSWAVAGWPEPLGLALHGAEAIGLACGFVCWRRLGATGR